LLESFIIFYVLKNVLKTKKTDIIKQSAAKLYDSGSCNRMKMDLTLPFFLEQIKKIYLNHKESSTTISKESTSKAIVDGSGEHLYYKDGDIVYPT
jgi:hypothetical protein